MAASLAARSHRTQHAELPHYALRKVVHSTAISCNFR
jgi:hypothetical protein